MTGSQSGGPGGPADTGTGEETFCGFDSIGIDGEFERFEQRNDIFCRGFWDERVINPMTRRFFRSFVKPADRSRDSDGFAPRDFALRNGPWVVTETLAELHKADDRRDGFWDDFSPHIDPRVEPPADADAEVMAAEVKQVARLYGADLVGITDYDERFTYSSKFSARGGAHEKPMELPDGLSSAIVIAKAMDYELIRTSPSATASAAPALGYAHDAGLLTALAQYIRSRGYTAVACQNDTTLAVPYALKAGLGEYGRNGILITREFGPRVRLGRVLTDMPLSHDAPIRFGVTETCAVCRRCANNCPPQAISHGEPSTYRFNISNLKGVRKWNTDAEKCFKFWVSRGTDCANCIRTCPYNKDYSKWYFQVLRFLLGTRLRRLALKLDDRLKLHERVQPARWWGDEAGPAARPPEEPVLGHAFIPDKLAQQERVKQQRDARKEQADSSAP